MYLLLKLKYLLRIRLDVLDDPRCLENKDYCMYRYSHIYYDYSTKILDVICTHMLYLSSIVRLLEAKQAS